MQIYSVLELILSYFGFTEFGVLEFSIINFTEFGMLAFLWNRQNPLFLCIGSARICRACYFLKDLAQSCLACFRFYFIFSWI